MIFGIPQTEKRAYEIRVFPENVVFLGDFYYFSNKEFHKAKVKEDFASIRDFMGVSRIRERSYRKTVLFCMAGLFLAVIKTFIGKLEVLADSANAYLRWIGTGIDVPEWLYTTMNVMLAICVLSGIVLFFSRKKMIMISFVTKQVCIPEKSLTNSEYLQLHQTISSLQHQKQI